MRHAKLIEWDALHEFEALIPAAEGGPRTARTGGVKEQWPQRGGWPYRVDAP
jgi:hypothetical protein